MPHLQHRPPRLLVGIGAAGLLLLAGGGVTHASGQGPGDLAPVRLKVEKKEYIEAQTELESYLADNPSDREAWELLGVCRKGRWDFEGASTAFRRAIDLGLENAPLLRDYVESEGRSSGGVALFFKAKPLKDVALRALELDPYDVRTRAALAAYYYYLPGIFGGDKERSERFVRELVELSPADGYYLLGIRAKEESKPDSVMLGFFETSLVHNPVHPLSLLEMGSYWIGRDWETGMEFYRRAVAAGPDIPEIRLAYARGYRREMRYEESAEEFLKLLELDPYYAPARLNLAENYEKRGMRTEAFAEYQRLARHNPTYRSREVRKRLRELSRREIIDLTPRSSSANVPVASQQRDSIC